MIENQDNLNNIFELYDKKNIERPIEKICFKSEDEAAMFLLGLFGQIKFSPVQVLLTKLFLKKWLKHYAFKDLITNMSMMLDKGEDYFNLCFRLPKGLLIRAGEE